MHTEHTLQFDTIKTMLQENAYSGGAKARIAALTPYLDEAACLRHAADTAAARSILEAFGAPPLPYMEQLAELLHQVETGAMLLAEQLSSIAQFASSCARVRRYLEKAGSLDDRIAPYGSSILELGELGGEIERCIRYEQVDSHASSALHGLRRQMEITQGKIKEKLNSLLANNKKWFSDQFVTEKNGRYVLPVKREHRNMVNGTVVEMSGSRGTYFIEPSSVGKLQDALYALSIEEDAEVRRILYELTALVEAQLPAIRQNMAAMEELDFVFAKAKLGQQMQGVTVPITTGRAIRIVAGRHPLLAQDTCVPLDIVIGGDTRGIIITGPNTGGKTVAIKTVGLLSMMAQSGLQVPADPASSFCMHAGYFCDIGDGQSITENLSTFSGHMRHVIDILEQATEESLVLLDELGSGTDPAEGMGIAIAVLEELRARGCLFLVTTHYAEVKEYAATAEGVMSARMAFDRETLSPLYRLEQGQIGESCALHIAQRLGLPAHILQRAYKEAYGQAPLPRTGKEAPLPPETQSGEAAPATRQSAPRIRRQEAPQAAPARADSFALGDSVMLPGNELGIVYAPADARGMLGVQVKGEKRQINHKRVRLHVPAEELYPEEYDFSILFDTVENRKARHQLSKGHRPGVEVRYDANHQ